MEQILRQRAADDVVLQDRGHVKAQHRRGAQQRHDAVARRVEHGREFTPADRAPRGEAG